MGTLVAVKKEAEICIAADALNLVEDIVQSTLNVSPGCILRVGDTLLGLQSTYTYQQALEEVLASLNIQSIPSLNGRHQIRKFFCGVHDLMKSHHQLIPAHQQGAAFEASPMSALLINRDGIFKVDAHRGVYEFKNFWSIGSASAFALGAMHSAYNLIPTAEGIAKAALAACGEFEANKCREIYIQTIKNPQLRAVKQEDAVVEHSEKARPVSTLPKRLPRRSKKD